MSDATRSNTDGRYGTPEEVAEAVAFLCRKRATSERGGDPASMAPFSRSNRLRAWRIILRGR